MNGKGDANRTTDRGSYRKNYGRIFKRRKKMDEDEYNEGFDRGVLQGDHERQALKAEIKRLKIENARLQVENEGLRKLPLVNWGWEQED